MTFNTGQDRNRIVPEGVLNLVINGWPSIHDDRLTVYLSHLIVLNLVINGWPSIQ